MNRKLYLLIGTLVGITGFASGCSHERMTRLNETPLYKTADGVDMRPLWGKTDLQKSEIKPVASNQPEIKKAKVQPKENLDRLIARLRSQLFFSSASDQINPAAKPQLDELAKTLARDPSQKIVIEGDADSVGPVSYNDELSKRRAEAVSGYLEEKGAAKGQIELAWKGEKKPIADNSIPEGRAKNRRVDLKSPKSAS